MASNLERLPNRSKMPPVRLTAFTALAVGCVLAGASTADAAGGLGPNMPYHGVVTSGSASISSPNAQTVQIDQSSSTAIITWSRFSVGQGDVVQFNNGSGATLNEVTGQYISSIDGALNATGSVYLINPNGVIIGLKGVVNVGGSFVASTLSPSDSNFLAGGDLTLSGTSSAGVVNLGKIGALGGDIVLAGNFAVNKGQLTASQGDVGLLAGSTVLLRDTATEGGKFAVEVGGSGGGVINSGPINAAMVELRANNGNVYALAGNTDGVINATAVAGYDGDVYLVATNGQTTDHVAITATQIAGGVGADVVTQGDEVHIDGATVKANNWTIENDSFFLGPVTHISTIADNLATTGITISTMGYSDGSGGNIIIPYSFSWGSSNALILSAYRDVYLAPGVQLTSTGSAPIILSGDNSGDTDGTVILGPGAAVKSSGYVSIQ